MTAMPMASLNPLRKMIAEDAQQQKSDEHLAGEPGRRERVVDEVRGCVGRRQGHGDDEVCGGESEEDEDEDLATPFWKQAFQHGDAALTVGTGLGHALIDRECAEQGDEYEDEGREWRKDTGSEESNAGLVTEGGEVVNASETHDAPPGVNRIGLGVHAFG